MEKCPAASGWPILSLPHGVHVCVSGVSRCSPTPSWSAIFHTATEALQRWPCDYSLCVPVGYFYLAKILNQESLQGRAARKELQRIHLYVTGNQVQVPSYPFLSIGVKVGPSRKLTGKGLINLKCGVGEKFYRYQRTQDKKSLDQIKPQFKLKRLKWGHRTLIIWWEDESHYKTQ